MPPPSITIDLAAGAPAYRQIVDQIRHLLVSGTLAPGAILPSVRRLAIDLGVHHNTVAEAYRTLAAEGWLTIERGKPARVADRDQPTLPRTEQKELSETFDRRLRHLAAEMRSQGLSLAAIAKRLRLLAQEVS